MQAETVPVLPGGEPVAEDAREIFRRDAHAVVGDRNPDSPARPARFRRTISLSGLPDSSQAYLALRIRLIRICSTLCFSIVMRRDRLEIAGEADVVPGQRAGVHAQAVLDQVRDVTISVTPEIRA